MKRIMVVSVLGVCALAAFLVSKRASLPAAADQSDDLRRWEDDGGHLPEVDRDVGRHAVVTVAIHST